MAYHSICNKNNTTDARCTHDMLYMFRDLFKRAGNDLNALYFTSYLWVLSYRFIVIYCFNWWIIKCLIKKNIEKKKCNKVFNFLWNNTSTSPWVRIKLTTIARSASLLYVRCYVNFRLLYVIEVINLDELLSYYVTYPWPFDTQIFRSGWSSHGGDICIWVSDSICSCPIINKSTVLDVRSS
jgi:hypothetical protein